MDAKELTDEQILRLADACGLYGVRRGALAFAREMLKDAAPTAPSLTTDAGAVSDETRERAYRKALAMEGGPDVIGPPPFPEQRMSDAARDVLAERARQVSAEGFTIEQDDRYEDGSLCLAAVCYARYYHESDAQRVPHDWPRTWESSWWKPTTPRRNLVKAAALILAEISRIDRAGGGS